MVNYIYMLVEEASSCQLVGSRCDIPWTASAVVIGRMYTAGGQPAKSGGNVTNLGGCVHTSYIVE